MTKQELEEKVQALEQELSETKELLEAALKENSRTTKVQAVTPVTFTIGKEDYKIIGGKHKVGNVLVTAEDIANDAELQKRLIEMGAGFIQKLHS